MKFETANHCLISCEYLSFRRDTGIQDFILNLNYRRGSTNIASALNMATNQLFGTSGDRSDVPNVIMVLTNGRSNDKSRTVQAAIEVNTKAGNLRLR